ncbi:jg22210 [Pararge aegeria aegeria]|uniref:Jg22210 protein n=1 Tax=Pararge aegeria aegeria TaxID=348720 RepID=A0A8S4QLX0_9NEOP|nr:jg22210 [Pararge aegeria aegeria]
MPALQVKCGRFDALGAARAQPAFISTLCLGRECGSPRPMSPAQLVCLSALIGAPVAPQLKYKRHIWSAESDND